jgi:PEP-CTERM motif
MNIISALLSLGMTMASSHAAINFNYSYTFQDGAKVSGSLTGTQNGDYVENISDVTMSLNGIAVSRTIFPASFDYNLQKWVDYYHISFNLEKCNIVLFNSDYAHGDYSYNTYFGVSYTWSASYVVTEPWPGKILHSDEYYDHPGDPSRWSLMAVPEPSTYLAGLSALGMLGLFGGRNRR